MYLNTITNFKIYTNVKCLFYCSSNNIKFKIKETRDILKYRIYLLRFNIFKKIDIKNKTEFTPTSLVTGWRIFSVL